MRVISTTCTLTLGGSSALGDATLENGSKASWAASRPEGRSWGVRVMLITCPQCDNEETIAVIKEAALAKIAEMTEKRKPA